ncbi:cytochrome P450 [Delitschia confertaspora ATCC 74209]|uniref:Cytochrome P450 n=1 Tax=Delitschia confertaspora ATCC 74209 TaxID=1513339 RepID=A0A9P4JS57_9PLEO|nr:cytochrome P450 [Delitschia confertaspora ATCC 74209]
MASSSPTIGLCLITMWLGWRLRLIIQYSQEFRRKRVTVVEYPSWLGRFVSRVRYLFKCPGILLQCYDSEYPIALPTPGPYFIHVSSKTHIEELSQAPEDTLSLHAFSKDLLQAKYTMDGIEFDDNMSENGAVHSRVLGVLLKIHLDDLQPSLRATISAATAQCLDAGSHLAHDWTEVNSFDFATRIVTHANAVVFFGAQLASDPAFIDVAMRYPNDLFLTAELLRFLPQSIRPYAARALKRSFSTPETLVAYLMPLVERRLEETHTGGGQQHRDLVQFFIDSSRRKGVWSAHRIVQVILGVWFASVHQPALTLVSILDDLHAQPEASRIIRDEISTMTDEHNVPVHVDQLPLLDSFLKESARLHPSDSITARRKAIKPFTFSDGTRLEKNDVVCISLEALMKDQRHYAHSQFFDAYRHMNTDSMTSQSRFSEPSQNFPLWGLGRHACPGRHYASRLLKLIVAHLISEYDIEMAGEGERQSRFFSWRTSILPSSACRIRIRKKAVSPGAN